MSGNDKSKPVGYVFSKECFELLNAVQKYAGRASKVHSLIESYGLLNRMSILRPIPASDGELLQFHSSDYLELIKRWSGEEIVTPRERGGDDDDYDGGGGDDDDLFTKIFGEDLKILEDYGFCYDCPPMRNTLPFIRHIAGSSITAARMVADGKMDCVVNWFGGWHHAKKSNASGYCYVNDVVLCIIELLKKFDKVLYIDLDLHHGDGLSEVFCGFLLKGFYTMAEALNKTQVEDQAFVTVISDDDYGRGALTLGYSLRRVETTRSLVCLVTEDISPSIRKDLADVYSVIKVHKLHTDFNYAFAKIQCWDLTQFSKCVFMDSDTLVLQNIDDLFEREEFSAVPNAERLSVFNPGLFVFKPSKYTCDCLLAMAFNAGFNGDVRELLNTFFRGWLNSDDKFHLPDSYNILYYAISDKQTIERDVKRKPLKDAKVALFRGPLKPWHALYDRMKGLVSYPEDPELHVMPGIVELWWKIFTQDPHVGIFLSEKYLEEENSREISAGESSSLGTIQRRTHEDSNDEDDMFYQYDDEMNDPHHVNEEDEEEDVFEYPDREDIMPCEAWPSVCGEGEEEGGEEEEEES